MNAEEIINFIATSEKKTPVKVYVREKPGQKVNYKASATKGEVKVFGGRKGKIVFGDWADIKPVLEANADAFDYYEVENDCRNSAVPMLDMKEINARIEPGAIIRDQVEIDDNAVIMMGAVIGEGTMIDMGVVLGGRAIVGKHCHIGAGTVLAGVVEPASATPVIVEDNVMIGANAVVLEGCRVGEGAVVAAGAVVVNDVPAGAVVAGVPAKVIKMKDAKTEGKTALVDALRTL